jgi:hypothetical protein
MECKICKKPFDIHILDRNDALKIHKFGGFRNRCFYKTSFQGFDFSGKVRDYTKTIRYNKLSYPLLKDSKNRPIIDKYNKKDVKISLRTGKVPNPYMKPIQEGQRKYDLDGNPIYLLDFSKPTPIPHPQGVNIIKVGEYIPKSLIKNSNFERCDFSYSIFTSFLKKHKSRIINCNFSKTIWKGAKLNNVIFKDCNMRGVDMTNLKSFKNVAFINCNMRGARIPEGMILQNPINENLMDNSRKRSKASTRKR